MSEPIEKRRILLMEISKDFEKRFRNIFSYVLLSEQNIGTFPIPSVGFFCFSVFSRNCLEVFCLRTFFLVRGGAEEIVSPCRNSRTNLSLGA